MHEKTKVKDVLARDAAVIYSILTDRTILKLGDTDVGD
jgi:hypothetical protein